MVSTRRDRGSEEHPRTRGRVEDEGTTARRTRGQAEHEDDRLDTDDGLPDHGHRRRSSRLMQTDSHGKAEDEQQDITDDDESDSDVDDDDEDDDEDVRVGRHSKRAQREQARQYKLRRRSIKTPATRRVTRSSQRAAGLGDDGGSESEEDGSDDGSEGDDDEELEEEGPDGVVVGSGRYKLRDRELVTIKRPPPPPGTGGTEVARKRQKRSLDQPRPRHQSSRHGNGLSMQRGGNRYAAISDDDELPDAQNGSDWRSAMAPVTFLSPRHPSAGGMLPNTPRQAAAHGGGGSGGGREPAPLTLADAAVNLGREKAANAEITPLEVDPSLGFDQVGGLAQYVRALKEMVFLPLVYPELFARFHVQPPRGVLFYGPPGTGKTLVARALAAHASRAGRKVSFFMRKGADILSKWVGEAERQLRLLFEEAQRQQPSIIFFDEIDGLAPVRSSRQDQIHNSIVSTLLALMDGLDSRGQVVIIGATNRIDAIDGALRRPGRFDRELLFPLPDVRARREILDIHTTKWGTPPAEELKQALADQCVGYCGADLKALCAEAALAALRRSYPQIYASEQRLLLDPCSVQVTAQDFQAARSAITPASHRAAATHAAPLGPLAAPCLDQQLKQVLSVTRNIFPPALALHTAKLQQEQQGAQGAAATAPAAPTSQKLLQACGNLPVRRARVLLCGREGAGQSQLGPAVLHELEGLPSHAIGLPSLLADAGSRSLEEALVHAFVEARRAAPAVLYLPHLELWWATAPASLRATLCMLLAELPPELPLLLLATAEVEPSALEPEARKLFAGHAVFQMGSPSDQQRRALFEPVVHAAVQPPAAHQAEQDAQAPCELPVDPAVQQQEQEAAAQAEAQAQRLAYEAAVADLRQLRMLLRSATASLLCDKRFRLFWQPVSPEEEPEYYEVVKAPMDLATVLARVDQRRYATAGAFMADMHAIVAASQQYWGDSPQYVRELSRAHELHDEALALLAARVPQGLRDRCDAIEAAGGPKPPPGMAAEQVPAAGAAHTTPWDAHRSKRTHTRSKSAPLSDEVLYGDPEASMRMLKQLKRQGQHSGHGGSKQHKAEQEQEQVHEEQQGATAAGTSQQQEQQEAGAQHAGSEQQEEAQQQEQQEQQQQQQPAQPGDTERQPDGQAAADPAEPSAAAVAALVRTSGPDAASSKQQAATHVQQQSDLQAVPDQQPAATAAMASGKQQARSGDKPMPAADTLPAQEAAAQQPAAPSPELLAAADSVLVTVVDKTRGMLLGQLELAVQKLSAVLQEHAGTQDRGVVLQAMVQVAGQLGSSTGV